VPNWPVALRDHRILIKAAAHAANILVHFGITQQACVYEVHGRAVLQRLDPGRLSSGYRGVALLRRHGSSSSSVAPWCAADSEYRVRPVGRPRHVAARLVASLHHPGRLIAGARVHVPVSGKHAQKTHMDGVLFRRNAQKTKPEQEGLRLVSFSVRRK